MMGEAEAEEDRVMEWEAGLPGPDELTPLSQPLVPPGLAAAFRIPPEPGRTLLDVHRASAATVSRLQGQGRFQADNKEEEEEESESSKKKRPRRLVWTPQLHRRFVDVVAHLGMKNAVPKTITQLMNVEGLTRENVASHLQKYRLYVKRMQGLSDEGPSPSDHIFASTPVPRALVVHQEVPAPPSSMMGAAMYHHNPHPMMGVASYQLQGGYGGVSSSSSSYQYHHANK